MDDVLEELSNLQALVGVDPAVESGPAQEANQNVESGPALNAQNPMLQMSLEHCQTPSDSDASDEPPVEPPALSEATPKFKLCPAKPKYKTPAEPPAEPRAEPQRSAKFPNGPTAKKSGFQAPIAASSIGAGKGREIQAPIGASSMPVASAPPKRPIGASKGTRNDWLMNKKAKTSDAPPPISSSSAQDSQAPSSSAQESQASRSSRAEKLTPQPPRIPPPKARINPPPPAVQPAKAKAKAEAKAEAKAAPKAKRERGPRGGARRHWESALKAAENTSPEHRARFLQRWEHLRPNNHEEDRAFLAEFNKG